MSDIFEVMNEVLDVAHNWRGIGLALGLHRHVLHRIEHRHGDSQCLVETLIEWLTYTTQPSWRLLVAALAHPDGGNDRALAERIAARHNGKCRDNIVHIFSFRLYKRTCVYTFAFLILSI